MKKHFPRILAGRRVFFALVVIFFAYSVHAINPMMNKRKADLARDLDTFPLWNSTWLIGKGQNDRIYPTVSKTVPTHLIKITFPSKANFNSFLYNPQKLPPLPEEIKLSWAILTSQNYKSTAHMINDVTRQFQINNASIRIDSLLEKAVYGRESMALISRGSIRDTVWFCDGDFANAKGYVAYRMVYNNPEFGVDTLITWTQGTKDTVFHSKRPIAFGEYPRVSVDTEYSNRAKRYTYMFPTDSGNVYYKDDSPEVDDDGWKDFCDDRTCYERIPITGTKSPTFNFWQVHLAPVVKWYPFSWVGDGPILHDELAMTFSEAKTMREKSIAYSARPDCTALLNYRRPFYSDSASCVISFQFRVDGLQVIPGGGSGMMPEFIKTAITNSEKNFDDFHIDRIPNRIMRVKSEMPQDLEDAILRLYAESPEDDLLSKSTVKRCGFNWRIADAEVGERYRFPDSAAQKHQRNKKFSPRTNRYHNHVNNLYPGGTDDELIFADNYNEKKYTYNNCSCLPIPSLNNFTASDLRSFIYRMPPLCSIKDMSNAMYVLLRSLEYINNDDDRLMLFRRIIMLYNALEDRSEFYKRLSPAQIERAADLCPESWEISFRDNNNQPLYRSDYTSDLKAGAERIINAYNTRPNRGIHDITAVGLR